MKILSKFLRRIFFSSAAGSLFGAETAVPFRDSRRFTVAVGTRGDLCGPGAYTRVRLPGPPDLVGVFGGGDNLTRANTARMNSGRIHGPPEVFSAPVDPFLACRTVVSYG